MSKFKISYISDCVFVFFLSFILFYAPLSYLLKRRIPSLIASFFGAIIALTVFIFVSGKKTGALAVKKSEEEEYMKCKNAFLLSDDKIVEQTMLRFLKKTKNQAQATKHGFALPDNTRAFYKFSSRPIGADEIIEAYKFSPKGCSIIFYAVSFDEKAVGFAKNLGMRITLVDFPSLFPMLKENNCTLLPPDDDLAGPSEYKPKIPAILISAFDRKKAKTFAFYGALTLIRGRFVAFKIYYTIVGCLLLLFAVILIFFAPKTSGGNT